MDDEEPGGALSASSGFAMRRPPRLCDKERSPFMTADVGEAEQEKGLSKTGHGLDRDPRREQATRAAAMPVTRERSWKKGV